MTKLIPARGHELADIYTAQSIRIEGEIADGMKEKDARNGFAIVRQFLYPAEEVIERRKKRNALTSSYTPGLSLIHI